MRRRLTASFFYYHSERCRRISVDIDRKHLHDEPLKILRVYFMLKNLFPSANLMVERTIHGFHVKAIDKTIRKLPIPKKVDLREALGDDPDRIDHDRMSIKLGVPYFTDTLFTIKFHSTGEVGMTDEVNPLALPYVSKIPAKKYRAH